MDQPSPDRNPNIASAEFSGAIIDHGRENGTSPALQKKKGPIRIGYAQLADPCWRFFHYHLMLKSAHFNVQIVARPFTTLREQIDELESLLDDSIDVLLFRPLNTDSRELLATVNHANQLGVSLIALDGSVGGGMDITTVSVNNEAGQAEIADYVCRRLNGQGKIAHLQGNQEMEAGRLRTRGLHRALENYPDINLVFEDSLDWGSIEPIRRQGQRLARSAITAHPDLAAFITASDECAFGVCDVLTEMGLHGKVLVTGFDALPEALIAIADGHLEASVHQPLELMAERALQDALRLTGDNPGEVTHTQLPAATITKENLVDSTLSALRLFPNVISELNQRRATQRANARFLDTLIDNLPHILVVKNAETLAYCRLNRAADAWLDAAPGELVGKTVFDVFPEHTARQICAADREILANGVPVAIPDEVVDWPHEGQRHMYTQNIPIIDSHGKAAYLLSILQDITEQKKAESELAAYSCALKHANVSLKENHEKLIAAEKMAALGSLVAGVAHELNTPIGNGLMAVSTLIDHTKVIAGNFPVGLTHSMLTNYLTEAANGAEILERNLRRAANLISSFKQIAIDQSNSQTRLFSLATLVSEVLLTLLPTLKKTAFEVRQSISTDIVMDSYPGPLEQVLINLINNAVVHGLAGRDRGHVTISASEPRQGWVELAVEDDGIGIPEAQIGRIFDPFFTTKSESGGSGLGLSISHNIVTGLLGGDIAVSSVVGTGTRFLLTLPTKVDS